MRQRLCGFDGFPLDGGAVVIGLDKGAIPNPGNTKATKLPVRVKLTPVQLQQRHPLHNVAPIAHAVGKVNIALKKAAASLSKTTGTAAAAAARGMAVVGEAIGAAGLAGKPATPKQQAAVAKAAAAKKKADSAGQALHASAVKAVAAAKKAIPIANAIKVQFGKGKKGVGVHGDLLGDDGTIDTTGLDDTTITDASTTPTTPAVPLYTPCNFPVPPDAIKYGSSPALDSDFPRYSVGSYSYFYGPGGIMVASDHGGGGAFDAQMGYIWGWNYGNYPNNDIAPCWVLRVMQHTGGVSGNPDIWDAFRGNPAGVQTDGVQMGSITPTVSQRSLSGQGIGSGDLTSGQFPAYQTSDNTTGPIFGPIIGNPKMDQFKNLRYSIPDNQFFFYLEEAPASLLAPLQYAAAKAKAAADAADAAATDLTNKQAAKDAADQAAAQAAQDAANALAESAETSAANVAASQQATQQAALDVQERQQALDERKQLAAASTTTTTDEGGEGGGEGGSGVPSDEGGEEPTDEGGGLSSEDMGDMADVNDLVGSAPVLDHEVLSNLEDDNGEGFDY